MMRPFVHSAMANVGERTVVDFAMREYPFSALTAEVGGRAQGFDRLSALIAAMRRRNRNVMVHRVPPKAEAFVKTLGVTHITLQDTDTRLKGAPSPTIWPDEPASASAQSASTPQEEAGLVARSGAGA